MAKPMNSPRPVVSGENWGQTLNNYLLEQQLRIDSAEDSIAELSNNNGRIISENIYMSSGVVWDNNSGWATNSKASQRDIDNGSTLENKKLYYWVGKIIFKTTSGITTYSNFQFQFSSDGLKMFNPVYASITSTGTPPDEPTVSIDTNENSTFKVNAYTILLGVIIKIGSNFYWNYKPSVSADGLSYKQQALFSNSASLDTYLTLNSSRQLGIPTESAVSQKSHLTLRGYYVNVNSIYDYWQTSITLNNFANNDGLLEIGITDTSNKIDGATWGIVAVSSFVVGNAPLFFLIEGTDDDASTSLWSFGLNTTDTSIKRYGGLVQLYRYLVNGSSITMYAAKDNGISPINANGLNPHITTLIKDSDNMRFGNNTNEYFHFKTSDFGDKYELGFGITTDGSTTQYILTDHCWLHKAINISTSEDVELTATGDVNLSSDKDLILGRYSTFQGTQEIVHTTKNINAYYQSGVTLSGNIANTSTISLQTKKLTIQTNQDSEWKDGLVLDNKSITYTTTGGDTESGIIVTDGTKRARLSPDGLYLPSGSSGVTIDDLEAVLQITNDRNQITINNASSDSRLDITNHSGKSYFENNMGCVAVAYNKNGKTDNTKGVFICDNEDGGRIAITNNLGAIDIKYNYQSSWINIENNYNSNSSVKFTHSRPNDIDSYYQINADEHHKWHTAFDEQKDSILQPGQLFIYTVKIENWQATNKNDKDKNWQPNPPVTKTISGVGFAGRNNIDIVFVLDQYEQTDVYPIVRTLVTWDADPCKWHAIFKVTNPYNNYGQMKFKWTVTITPVNICMSWGSTETSSSDEGGTDKTYFQGRSITW